MQWFEFLNLLLCIRNSWHLWLNNCRFEQHYAPNVALAPLAYKSKEDDKSEEGMGALQKLAEAAASRLSPPGKEYELSTDTEGSSCGQISPSDCKFYFLLTWTHQ